MSDFYGLPTGVLENEFVRLEYLSQAGPRLVRFSLAGSGVNVLAELPDLNLDTPLGPYAMRGGHRLWHAPEAMPRSYLKDDSGLIVRLRRGGVHLTQPVEALTGLQKSMDVALIPGRAALTIRHTIRNLGAWPVEFAPWSITQMRTGGTGIFPLPDGPADEAGLLPSRSMAFWPYSRMNDPRLTWLEGALALQAEPGPTPFKLGAANRHGWLAYAIDGLLFCKRFETPSAGQPYPDFGCNAEMYTCNYFQELESLGRLQSVVPGASATHVETWELYPDLNMPGLPDEIRAYLSG
jgi:hypothetical protein